MTNAERELLIWLATITVYREFNQSNPMKPGELAQFLSSFNRVLKEGAEVHRG